MPVARGVPGRSGLHLCHEKVEVNHLCPGVVRAPSHCAWLRSLGLSVMAPPLSSHSQVALLDVDICGPSIPKIMGLEGEQVIADGESDWVSLGKHIQ